MSILLSTKVDISMMIDARNRVVCGKFGQKQQLYFLLTKNQNRKNITNLLSDEKVAPYMGYYIKKALYCRRFVTVQQKNHEYTNTSPKGE